MSSLTHKSQQCLIHACRLCQEVAQKRAWEAREREESRPPWCQKPCRICGFVFGHAPDCRWPTLHAYYAQMGVEYE